MVIKNKDGTAYRLQSPNPLSKNQEDWGFGDEQYVLHNCHWEDEIADGPPVLVAPKLTIVDKFVEEQVTIEPQPASEPEEEPLPESTIKDKLPEGMLKNMVIMHCLPVILESQKDDFYDEERVIKRFGKKFTIEAVIIKREDYQMLFWTTIDLEKGSIVYPSKYVSQVKYSEYRWWEVNEKEPKANGHLISSIPSKEQPDFS